MEVPHDFAMERCLTSHVTPSLGLDVSVLLPSFIQSVLEKVFMILENLISLRIEEDGQGTGRHVYLSQRHLCQTSLVFCESEDVFVQKAFNVRRCYLDR